MPPTPLRARWVPVALAALVVALPACSGSSDSDATSTTTEAGAATSGPIVIEHAYGTMELAEPARKVVALGWLEADIATALGVEPIVIGGFPFTDSQIAPWLEERLTSTPEIMETAGQGTDVPTLGIERLHELQPDLILANSYSALPLNIDDLERVAPVLGPSEETFQHVSWQDHTRQVAKALGKDAEAEALIEEVEAGTDATIAEHQELAGRSYTLSLGVPDMVRVVQDQADQAIALFDRFGLEYSETAAALPNLGDGSGGASVSEERLDDIDADVVVMAYIVESAREQWESSEVFQSLDAVRDGGYVALDTTDLAALRNPSPLSFPYSVDTVVVERVIGAVEGGS